MGIHSTVISAGRFVLCDWCKRSSLRKSKKLRCSIQFISYMHQLCSADHHLKSHQIYQIFNYQKVLLLWTAVCPHLKDPHVHKFSKQGWNNKSPNTVVQISLTRKYQLWMYKLKHHYAQCGLQISHHEMPRDQGDQPKSVCCTVCVLCTHRQQSFSLWCLLACHSKPPHTCTQRMAGKGSRHRRKSSQHQQKTVMRKRNSNTI